HPGASPLEPRRVDSPRPSEREARVRRAGPRRWPWLVTLLLLAGAAYELRATRASRQPAATEAPGKPVGPSVPVVAATAREGDMPVYLSGLGSVLAFNTVTVKSRVDGQLVRVAFQVGQLEGAIRVDQALIDTARLQLEYARITAPISGRVGLRLLDVGNMVHPSDPNGLVVITQLQPITVVFTIPEDDLPPVMKKLTA